MHWVKCSPLVFQRVGCMFSIIIICVIWLCLSSCVPNEPGIPVGKNATADKPQSKVWYEDGSWWCILDDGQESSWFYRLEGKFWRKATFEDASVYRGSSTRADVLSASNSLYVLVWEAENTRFFKYRYYKRDRSYSLEKGFPVEIDLIAGHETASFALDSREVLWITYEAEGKVYISWSGTGLDWQQNEVLGSSLKDDDISSVISFDNQVGVFWSNQKTESLHFRVREDSDSSKDWKVEESVVQGGLVADDHVNLATAEGLVYAATKTSVDDGQGKVVGPTQAQIILNVRSKEGVWAVYDVAPLSSENVTRPIVVLDDENHEVYVFYRKGDEIVYKRSSLAEIDFSGDPSVAIEVEGVTLNNVTSTKQNVSSKTGLLVLATGDDDRAYHRLLPIH